MTGSIDVAAALARRNEATSNWEDSGQLPWLVEHHVDLIRGTGRLAGARRVEVTAPDGSVRSLPAGRAVVVATGTSAAIPPIPGLSDAKPWNNRDITATQSVPRRLLVLGGGAIGAEMAQAFRRLGSEVRSYAISVPGQAGQ